jgi:hypothetical protein
MFKLRVGVLSVIEDYGAAIRASGYLVGFVDTGSSQPHDLSR